MSDDQQNLAPVLWDYSNPPSQVVRVELPMGVSLRDLVTYVYASQPCPRRSPLSIADQIVYTDQRQWAGLFFINRLKLRAAIECGINEALAANNRQIAEDLGRAADEFDKSKMPNVAEALRKQAFKVRCKIY